ncbi:MAG: aminotransferase class V-fold PLP-dependent enzyme [Planctomycetota bacterium]
MDVRLGSRALFPRLEAKIYLAHAAISPASLRVEAALEEGARRQATEGLPSIAWGKERAQEARERFALLAGVDPERVAHVQNTSSGLIAIANSFRWRSGDKLLCFDGEFPTNVIPWREVARVHDLHLDLLPVADFAQDHGLGLGRLEEHLRQGVRLVAVSAVQFQSGLAMPIPEMAALCKRYGARLCVDAIQAIGAMPFCAEDWGVDYLAVSAHKWLMGPLGSGFLYVSEEAHRDLDLHLAGWMSLRQPESFLFPETPDIDYATPLASGPESFETGILNYNGIAASSAGMQPLVELGTDAIFAHLQAWHDDAEARLTDRGFTSLRHPQPAGRSGILSFTPPAGVELGALTAKLWEQGIAQTAPNHCWRLAPHWPNALDEPARLVEAL